MRINTASQAIGAQMVTAADGTAFTGAVTVYVTGDAGVQAIGSVGVGACVHEGNGYHTYAPAQAETNYSLVAFTFIGTGAVPATLQIYTAFPQTGDSFARIGAAGAGLTALGDTRVANLDAAVSSRMATYAQPAGFLAATFPTGTVANTTNITAGTVTTATNLTNLPTIPANWLTAAGIAASAMNGKGDWNIGKTGYSLTQAFPTNFSAMSLTAGGLVTLAGVTHTGAVIPTVSTLTGHTAQTGDNFARIGVAGAGLTALGDLRIANLDATVSSVKAKTDLIPAAPAAVADIPTAVQNADALLNRDMNTGTDSGSATIRTVRQALRFLRNKWTLTGTTLSVKKEDDTTESWAGVVTTTAGADPITGSDPA